MVTALALASGTAEAATTVGSSLRQRANLYVRCGGDCTSVQTARPGGAGLAIPADGVISRWRIRAATLGFVRIRILRQEQDGGWTAVLGGDWVHLDRTHQPGQDVLYEFPVRIPVHAGDVVAIDRDAKAGGIFHSYGDNTTYAVAEFAPMLKDDAVDAPASSNNAGRELLMNVDVEKDDDGDGFGDESVRVQAQVDDAHARVGAREQRRVVAEGVRHGQPRDEDQDPCGSASRSRPSRRPSGSRSPERARA